MRSYCAPKPATAGPYVPYPHCMCEHMWTGVLMVLNPVYAYMHTLSLVMRVFAQSRAEPPR
jgi:hypothetical protein